MNPTLEDLVRSAKLSGSAAGDGVVIIYYDFDKTATSGTIGVKKTGVKLPARNLILSGILTSELGVTGAFAPQVVASGDIFPAQTGVAANAIVDAVRTFTGASGREILLNVTALTAGKVLIFLNFIPL